MSPSKIDSRRQLEELKSKLEPARSKLDEAKAAENAKWEAFKQGIEHTWQELDCAFKKLVAADVDEVQIQDQRWRDRCKSAPTCPAKPFVTT